MTNPLSRRLRDALMSTGGKSSKRLREFASSPDYSNIWDDCRVYRVDGEHIAIGVLCSDAICGRFVAHIMLGAYSVRKLSYNKKPHDVTEWFIEQYAMFGACFFDDYRHAWGKHDDCDDLPDGATRTCVNCGKIETVNSKFERKAWWQ